MDEKFLVLYGAAYDRLVPTIPTWPDPHHPMAKEFTSDIVQRKNLAYVTHGGPNQTLDLYALKNAKQFP